MFLDYKQYHFSDKIQRLYSFLRSNDDLELEFYCKMKVSCSRGFFYQFHFESELRQYLIF